MCCLPSRRVAMRVLDAACGSNSLYIALRRRDLEKRSSRWPDSWAALFFPMSRRSSCTGSGERLRARTGAGDDLDRLHPMDAGQRLRLPRRPDPQAAGFYDPPHGCDPGPRRRRPTGGTRGRTRTSSSAIRRSWANKIRQGWETPTWTRSSLYAGRVPAFADLLCYWFEGALARASRRSAAYWAAGDTGHPRRREPQVWNASKKQATSSGRKRTQWVLDGTNSSGLDGGLRRQAGRRASSTGAAVHQPDLTAADSTVARQLQKTHTSVFAATRRRSIRH